MIFTMYTYNKKAPMMGLDIGPPLAPTRDGHSPTVPKLISSTFNLINIICDNLSLHTLNMVECEMYKKFTQ